MFENLRDKAAPAPRRRVVVLAGAAAAIGVAVAIALLLRREPPPAVAPVEPALPVARPPISPGAMVRIAGGSFRMGSEQGGDDDERPAMERTVAPFEIDVLEVTVADFEGCVKAGRCEPPLRAEGKCNWGDPGRRDHPVNCVDHPQAAGYCAFAGKRLPTEAEWEMAARGMAARTYPWGETPPAAQLCWNGEGNEAGRGGRNQTCVVGTHLAGATPEGVHDLSGNVWEWTSSRYCPYGADGCTDERFVLRGGGFNNSAPAYVRGADRAKDRPQTRNDNLGFRCAR